MADVFLSYKREDAARVRKLVIALRKSGLNVWWDEDIPPSAPWEATIEKALVDAKTVIVCWSPASVASENVRSEARVAREDGRLIQVFIKACSPPLFFGERQGVNLSKWRGNADDPRIATLKETIVKVAVGEQVEGDVRGAGRSRGHVRTAWRLGPIVTLAAIVVILLGVGSLIAYRGALARTPPQLAVLPFEDLSPTRDKAYFAEGVAEEILSTLSTNRQFKVLGRTSARQIDRHADPRAVRKSLGVTHLLEGSARTAGDALRVNVRLIDTRDGSTVWQDEYRGRSSDVFAVQDRIASAVAQNLRGVLSRAGTLAARPVTKIKAYETYLAARAIMRNRTEPSLRQAFALAQQVVVADPNYAPGHALYAELMWLLSDDPDAYGSVPAATAARIGEQHARTAIRLAPNQAEGHAALGLVTGIIARDSAAIPALRHAIALDPSRADARIWLATLLTQASRYDEALPLSRDAAAIEPLWAMPIYDFVVRLAVNGQAAEARRVAAQYRGRGGSEGQYHRILFAIESRGSDISSAIAEGQKALGIDPTLPTIRSDLIGLFDLVGLQERSPKEMPSATRLAAPFFRGDASALQAQIRSAGADVWNLPDSGFGFFHLAAARDWAMLNRLYDLRRIPAHQLCFRNLDAAQAIVPALRQAGRQRDALNLLSCLRNRLAIEVRQKARSWYAYAGNLEYDQATLAALDGNAKAALGWLKRAVERGWLGRPYSARLSDRPQFAFLAGYPQLAALQAAIDRRIARERAEVVAQRR